MHMFSVFSVRRNWFRLTFLTIFIVVFYNEYATYVVKSLAWPAVTCGDIHKFYTILLVADPQILGEKSEPWFARWDNDRYLRQSFAMAFRHVQPDLVIFLGDLMDEGSLATDEEYRRYFSRFQSIFRLDHIGKNKTLFVPGDNDIGGEDEIVTDKKVTRFKQFFYSPSSFELESIQFVQVDKMQRIVPKVPSLRMGDNRSRIVITHMPVLGLPSAFAAEVLQKLRPHIILSAHDHKSVHFSGDIETGERQLVETLLHNQLAEEEPSWRFQRSDHLVNEVVVPTCSYRMGVPDMGYGVVLVDERGDAWCYKVLWLPSRFQAHFLYLGLLVLLATIFNWKCCISSICSKQRLSPQFRKL